MANIDLSNRNDDNMSNIDFSIKAKEVQAVIIKSNDEQLNFIKSTLDKNEDSPILKMGQYEYCRKLLF